MLWVVQDDLYHHNKRTELLNALSRLDIAFITVKVKNNTIAPDIKIDNNERIMTNGSIMLSQIAIDRGWWSGEFLNDNFSYKVWSQYYHDFILNKDGIISSLGAAVVREDKVFVRPILDNKTFNGRVFTKEEFLEFQQQSIHLASGLPKPETQILLSQPKKIGQEHRHYIVDGEIVTSSRYKLSGQPNFSLGCDEKITDMVKKAILQWQPSRAFVLDSYVTGDEIGIVEIGGICHAGLYEADIMKLVMALDSMPQNNQ